MGAGPLPSSSRGRARRAPMADINVTPLVDVMLVLLIIFMVTAPLLVSGVPIKLPETRAKGLDQGEKPVQVSVNAKGEIYVDTTPVKMEDLGAALAKTQESAENPAGPLVYFRADETLTHGRALAVLGEINRAGITRVALLSTAAQGPAGP
jgi:biopolymer transport protein TolR